MKSEFKKSKTATIASAADPLLVPGERLGAVSWKQDVSNLADRGAGVEPDADALGIALGILLIGPHLSKYRFS